MGTGKYSNRIYRTKRLVIAFFFCFLTFPLMAQSTASTEEDPLDQLDVSIQLDEDRPVVQERFIVRMIVDYRVYYRVLVEEPELPDGVVFYGRPYFIPINLWDDNGNLVRKTQITYTLISYNSGVFRIDPFLIQTPEQEAYTEGLDLVVLQDDERNLKFPVEAQWVYPDSRIYVGQSFPLTLQAINLEEINTPTSFSFAPPQGGIFDQADNLGLIESSSILGTSVYHIPAAAWMVTPTEEGLLTIPRGQLDILGLSRRADSVDIEVFPVPELIRSSGAIGDFDVQYTYSVSDENPAQIQVLAIVSGEGNLEYLQMPVPEAEGLVLLGSEDEYNVDRSIDGYSGEVRRLYRFQAETSGTYTITFPAYRWLDPISGNFGGKNSDTFSRYLEVSSQESGMDQYEPGLISPEDIQMGKPKTLYKNWIFYLLFLPGIVFFIVFLVLKKLKKGPFVVFCVFLLASGSLDKPISEELIHIQSLWDSESYQEAASASEEFSNLNPEVWELWYNQGICFYASGDTSKSIYSLIKALRLNPLSREIKEALDYIYTTNDLSQQVYPSAVLSPEIIFALVLFLSNIFFVLLAFVLKNRKGGRIILLVVTGFFLLVSCGYFMISLSQNSSDVGVVVSDTGLRRVPVFEAEDWITLNEGSVVQIVSDTQEDFLITTGYGIKGWISKDRLLRISE